MKKIALTSTIVALIGLMAIRPFNYFCNLTSKCQPIIASYYLPTISGTKEIHLNFLAINNFKEIEFITLTPKIAVLDGKAFKVTFKVKNLSDNDLKIRPRFIIEPSFVNQYLRRYQCLCFKEYLLKKRSDLNLVARFKINKEIENDDLFVEDQDINIGYEMVDISVLKD